MAAFPLANLNSTLLEMVITKLDGKSYFHLQQTCRGMNDFIRRNKTISVHLNWKGSVSYAIDAIFFYKAGLWHPIHIDPDTLYGTRLTSLYICGETSFEYICDCLKKYRLTFATVDISTDKWTKEQILTILKLAKPLKIFLNSEESNGYEALFHSKSLKTVSIDLNQDQVAIVVPKLLLTFSKVNIYIYYSEQPFELLRTGLRFLLSQPLPNLREFNFCTMGNYGTINTDHDDLEKEFREFNLVVKKKERGRIIEAAVEMPPHFPEGTFCSVVIQNGCFVDLKYCGL